MNKCPYGKKRCPPDLRWPHIATVGFSGVRYFSLMNPWIDFVVLFDESQYKVDTIVDSISAAMESYWDGDEECFGDAVYCCLDVWGVQHYAILFHDTEDESGEYEDRWDHWIGNVNIVKTLH